MYSKELIEGVKELYPDSKEMNQLAASGNVWLGRYLDDSSSDSISIDTVLAATSLEDLKREARAIGKKRALYRQWCKEDPRRKI